MNDKTNYREWPYKEAERIVKRCERHGGKKNVVLETGYGPSGLPHIGTFGEVARTSFVIAALKEIAPEIETHLIAFSDDMDGLREVPSNIPNGEKIKKHLGKPLTCVPDPFGLKESYAGYMNGRLCEFLDSFGFTYEFRSSSDQYKNGVFDEGLRRIMNNYDKVRDLFIATISKDKRADWSPFFPLCEKCGKIYSTRVTGIDRDNYKISYVCDQSVEGKYDACGYEGETVITGGKVKTGWKVDWALRWYAFGIDYEMHGEDLTESGRLSAKIVRVIGGKPPELFKYELFLDETGKKISKKIGNGVSLDQWLSYGPVDSLLYFMYNKPVQTKKLGLPIFPKIVDEYLTLIAGYDGTKKDHAGNFIIRLAKQGHADSGDGDKIITYSLLYNLLIALAEPDEKLLLDYLLRYQPQISKNIDYYRALVAKVICYYNEYYLPTRIVETPDPQYDKAVKMLHERLESADDSASAKELQNIAYQIAKENDIDLKEWFTNLYKLFLGQSTGPRIGSFITLLGRDKVIERLRNYLSD